ncbi:NAD(P)/FAD-dependent oxidoreductase [Clostridium akagii]|uniref:NAD(P)/FAD-dependent oxidoreductase n=1 Tax=Clostridium akagii TaxID=91623 RepID=UPI00047ADDEF|nr:NAD(P)/FAD-dependent oxidoreductase [Clostridium akagii]
MKHNIIVIGGGASGIIAAITAKDLGSDIAILESNDRIGKKILTTGNGRCNITNSCCDFSRYHSDNSNFFNFALDNFNYKATESFFSSLGLPLVTLDDGKMYPMSLQASSVLDILRATIIEREIPVYFNSKVKKIEHKDEMFRISTSENVVYECNKVILATGGTSAPKSGSDGSGYLLSAFMGHSIIDPVPSLVQLKLQYKNLKSISGVKFNGYAHILVNNETIKKEFGEILFTDYGISGPPILQLSRVAGVNLLHGQEVTLVVDMMPNYSPEELRLFLENHLGTFSYRSIFDCFIGLINKKLIPVLLKEAQIYDIHKPCYDLQWKEKENLLKLLKSWKFKVTGTNSFTNSQVTAGGVDTKLVSNETLESKKIKNLYFCGEILDVDGDCGGFNLQWAWSSGFLAGKNAGNGME